MANIELVIKIPEKVYKYYCDGGHLSLFSLKKYIKNGTPLPKGHGELIDREKTVERICKIAEFMNEKRKKLGGPYILTALFIQDNKAEFPTIVKADRAECEE